MWGERDGKKINEMGRVRKSLIKWLMGNFWKGRKSKKNVEMNIWHWSALLDEFVSKTVRWKRVLPADTGYAHNKYTK